MPVSRIPFAILVFAVAAACSPSSAPAAVVDRESARFAPCVGGKRVTCVVDGDTFWYRGQKVRIADINTPEVSKPGCPREAALGAEATRRLIVLLNSGPFTLQMAYPHRPTDRYGRALVVVTRDGESLGMKLADEGLAEPWKGRRGNWCR